MAKDQAKPKKPYEGFPLFAHSTGRWCKKIRGTHRYFGPWDDPEGALERYESQRDDLYAGRTTRVRDDELTIRDLLNAFMTEKRHRLDSGELAPSTFKNYYDCCARIGRFFGKTRSVADLGVEDFRDFRAMLAKSWAASTLSVEITRCRSVFRFGFENHLLSSPIRHGSAFQRPTKTSLRKARNKAGLRMFEADDIRRMLAVAAPELRAAILLGISCGFSNSDIRALPRVAVDLKRRWIHFPRPKTGVDRKCPLWLEAADALGEIIAANPPKNTSYFRLLEDNQERRSGEQRSVVPRVS
jgi:integrase